MRVPIGLLVVFGFTCLQAAEVPFPEHGLAFTCPDNFERATKTEPGVLFLAVSKAERIRVMFTKPPFPAAEKVTTGKFHQEVKGSLAAQGFPRPVRTEVIQVADEDAFLCEAASDKGPSLTQVVWIHKGSYYSFVVLSLDKSTKEIPVVQQMLASMHKVRRD